MSSPTIRDVARRAEVSVASVSRALTGSGRVSEATRDRIDRAVRDLCYVPHAGARSLSLARTNAIGVMLPAVHGEFYSEIVRGMDIEAAHSGYLLLLSNLHGNDSEARRLLAAMRGRVDGLLLMAPHLGDEALAALPPSDIPTLLINSRGPPGKVGALHVDNRAGVDALIDHLAAIGKRHIAHIAGPADNFDAQERREAFLAAASRNKVEATIVQGDFFEQSGGDAVAELERNNSMADAIFAANDNMAIGALVALRQRGRRVPEDVAVAGFDDIPLAQHLGITTVQVRIAEMGRRALAKLVSAIDGKDEVVEEFHQPELVIRGTTDPLASNRS